MKRTEKLETLKREHAEKWEGMSPAARKFVMDFIEANEALDYNDWAGMMNAFGMGNIRGWGVWQDQLNSFTKKGDRNAAESFLTQLGRTEFGDYGFHGERRFIHPVDRINKNQSFGWFYFCPKCQEKVIDQTEVAVGLCSKCSK